MKIYLSPSMQENNVGAGDYGTEEKRMNQLTDILQPLLIKYGHVVYRNSPTMTLTQAVNDSNTKDLELHLALHTNASNGLARGCMVFCHKFNGDGEQYARAIFKYLEPLTPSKDYGIKEGYNYYNGKPMYELAYTNAPAVLVEIAFHDNISDAEWIKNNLPAIATAITNGINEIAGIEIIFDNYKEKFDTLSVKYDALVADIKILIAKYQK